MRNLRARLGRLERAIEESAVPESIDSAEPLSDDEAADRTGEFLWLTPDWNGHSRVLDRNPQRADKAAAFRAWDMASKAARAVGQTTYNAGLRAQAMAVWRTMKPDILELERAHGRWISVAPALGDE